MLSKENYEGLKCLFETIQRMTNTKTKLKTIIKDHIYQIGYQSIEQISAKAIQVCCLCIPCHTLCCILS
jgi:hypothetical protein